MTEMDKQLLAERVRSVLPDENVTHRPMFGNIGFMLNGNLLCGASRKGLMIRTDPVRETDILTSPHVTPIRMSARKMPGFLRVDPDGLASDEDLEHWIGLAMEYVSEMPKKEKK
ncbi:TfoX/Sxy family protein [uncultured Roseibium sp.]|uniref:TfoX/Sxy family protein n=1 Tax=uncultured Roseibium sp. TaxID=1936171 RepID=UPI0032171711